MKQYLSVRQVAQRLNNAISVKLVYKLISQGKLRANRAIGKILVEEDSLAELMEGKQPAAPPAAQPSMAVEPVPRRGRKPKQPLW